MSTTTNSGRGAGSVVDRVAAAAVDLHPDGGARIETSSREWKSPMRVDSVDLVQWTVPHGERDWITGTVTLDGPQVRYEVRINTPAQSAALYAVRDHTEGRHAGRVISIEAADPEPASEPVWCDYPGCGHGPTTNHGLSVHTGYAHDGTPRPRHSQPPAALSTDLDTLERGVPEAAGTLAVGELVAAVAEATTLTRAARDLDLSVEDTRVALDAVGLLGALQERRMVPRDELVERVEDTLGNQGGETDAE